MQTKGKEEMKRKVAKLEKEVQRLNQERKVFGGRRGGAIMMLFFRNVLLKIVNSIKWKLTV